MNSSVKLTISPAGVAVITLDLPGSKVNVLSQALMGELDTVLDVVAADAASAEPTICALVLSSGKRDNFCAGADLDLIDALQMQPSGVAYAACQKGKATLAKLRALPFPTVAAINGTCLGGGLEVALHCKYRLATDSPATKLGLPEVGLGFIPGLGGTVSLTKLLGVEGAMKVILQPLRTFDGKKAWRAGFVDEVVPSELLLERAQAVALGAKVHRSPTPLIQKLRRKALEGNWLGRKVLTWVANKGIYAETRGKYPAPPAAFKVMLSAVTATVDRAMDQESLTFARLATTPESRKLVGLFFASQSARKATANVGAVPEIKKIGMVGAGVMGSGIAYSALYAGYRVVLFDKFAPGLAKGEKVIESLFAALVEKGKLTRGVANQCLANLTIGADLSDLSDCDLVIEAIREDMDDKQGLLADLEKVMKEGFIFATNTSALSVTTMAERAWHPENVGGLHFFNPVHKMPLVEVVEGAFTSPETLAVLKAFAGKLGKTTVVTSDSPGFVVNRILAPYLYESIHLMEAGVPFQDIEDAMKKFGMKMGPLALLDEVGLDIASKVIHVLHEALGDRITPPSLISYFEEQKLLGKKGGKGIYLWDKNERRTGFNRDLIAWLDVLALPKTSGEIQDRLLLAMINEAARCLEEKVVSDPAQLDLAMVFGTGFPPFRGGLLRFADELGSRTVLQKLTYLSQVAGDNYKPSAMLVALAEKGEGFYG